MKEQIWESITRSLLRYWTGFCIGWLVFGEPKIGYLFLVYFMVVVVICALGLILFLFENAPR